jgi:hypothetical protein
MATRGFEFAYMIDGSNATPLIRDMTLGVAAAHNMGDIMLIASDGYADAVTASATEVTGVMQEAIAAADITAGTTKGKMAIVTGNQVWRCSSDASTATTAKVGYIKTQDVADANTIDATDITNGSLIVLDHSEVDDDGNLIFYVIFNATTFGGA